MNPQISSDVFFNRLERIHEVWSQNYSRELDSIILINGKATGGNEKTIAIVTWLLDAYNLTDIILAFSQKKAILFASEKKMKYLKTFQEDKNSDKIILMTKTTDLPKDFEHIWNIINEDKIKPKIGMFERDQNTGNIVEEFKQFLDSQSFSPIEIEKFFNDCFMVKDQEGLLNLRKSSFTTCYFTEKMINEIEGIIDEEKAKKHHQICMKIQQLIMSEDQLKKCETKIKMSTKFQLEKQFIDMGPSINIQSGGQYSDALFREPSSASLQSDCIITSLGTMYKGFNSYVSRTLFINPSQQEKQTYQKSLQIFRNLIEIIKPGERIKNVYQQIASKIKDTFPQIRVPSNFGFGIGMFLSQNSLQISPQNDEIIPNNSSFLVRLTLLGFKGVNYSEFAIQLIDTMIVTKHGQELLTESVDKSLKNISYQMENEQKQTKKNKKIPGKVSAANIIENSDGRRMTRRASKYVETVNRLNQFNKRNQHQKILKTQKRKQIEERVNENFNPAIKKQKTINFQTVQSYHSPDQLPKYINKNEIHIDQKKKTILLPINGKHIPFHLSLLKSVVKSEEQKIISLRFNFYLPGNAQVTFPNFEEPTIFVKEIVYRSKEIKRCLDIDKKIKQIQKKQKENQKSRESHQPQANISLNKGKKPILKELGVKPIIGTRKNKGNLQCHFNGFRFTTEKQNIDIAFDNIKKALFQPTEKQMIAAIHFRLHKPILINKKLTEDVQFYIESIHVSEDLSTGYDSDDEERLIEKRELTDKEFLYWISCCEEFIKKQFEFQIPEREKGFYGNVFKHNSLIQPTKSSLMNVTQSPFFVCCLDDVEIACFERVLQNNKTFDLTFVMKDYETYIQINAISMKVIEDIKTLLDSKNIIFYNQNKNLSWAKFLSGIRKDFQGFVEENGWMAWDQADEKQQEDSFEEDESFQASSEEYSDSDSGSEDDYEEEDDSSSEQSLSQEGLSMDDLEEVAEREDRVRQMREREREQKNMGASKRQKH